MGILDAFNAFLSHYDRDYRNQQFLEAAMASTALLAIADGSVSFAELMARDDVIERIGQLQGFDVGEAVELFRIYGEKLTENPKKARKEILKLSHPLAEDRELALLLLRMALVVAKADQTICPTEWQVLRELAKEMKISEVELETFVDRPF